MTVYYLPMSEDLLDFMDLLGKTLNIEISYHDVLRVEVDCKEMVPLLKMLQETTPLSSSLIKSPKKRGRKAGAKPTEILE